jgi:hypothetical protein
VLAGVPSHRKVGIEFFVIKRHTMLEFYCFFGVFDLIILISPFYQVVSNQQQI